MPIMIKSTSTKLQTPNLKYSLNPFFRIYQNNEKQYNKLKNSNHFKIKNIPQGILQQHNSKEIKQKLFQGIK